MYTSTKLLCAAATFALANTPLFACAPPPPGSSYALAIAEQKSESRRTANVVAEGRWHYTRKALLADKRMDARLAAEPPGGTKIKNFRMSYAIVLPTKVTRGKIRKSYKVWYSRLNQTCPSEGQPEGTTGTFYLKRIKIDQRDAFLLVVFDKDKTSEPTLRMNQEKPQ